MNKARLKVNILLGIIICIISISFIVEANGYLGYQYKNPKGKIEFFEKSPFDVIDSNMALAPGLPMKDYPISTAKNDQNAPVVAYNSKGNEYLVAWCDERNRTTSGKDIYARIVSPTGELKGTEIPIDVSSGDQWGIDIAYNSIDDEYLIIWNDEASGDIQGQRISSAGALIGDKFDITDSARAYTASLAYNSKDNKYLVIWDEGDISQNSADIYGQLLSNDATLQGSKSAICSEPYNQYNPAIAYNSNSNEFFVVWQDERNTLGDIKHIDIYGKRITGLGQPSVSDISISPVFGDEFEQLPSIAYNNVKDGYLVVWMQGKTLSSRDIYGLLVTGGGAMESNPIILCSAIGKQSNPTVAYSETDKEYLIVWDDARGANEDIYGQRLSETGQLNGSNFAVSTALDDQNFPATIYNIAYSNYLVAWCDNRNKSVSAGDIYVQIIGDIVAKCLKGDVDGNGVVNAKDALLALQFVVNMKTPTDQQKCGADVNEDGEIRANDVIKILQIAVGSASPINMGFEPSYSSIGQNALLQNFPNPFNPETWIPYQLKSDSEVAIRIFNANGDLVREIDLGYRSAGMYISRNRSAYWDGKDKYGVPVASGIYFYNIHAGDFSAIRKMIVQR